MKVLLRNPRRELDVVGKRSVNALLAELQLSRESHLVIRNGTLVPGDAELAADLVNNGITLAGGGALLRGLDIVLQTKTGLDVKIANDPLTCVARGTGNYLENLEQWKTTLVTDGASAARAAMAWATARS